ncbi:amidohydrolase family protein [Diaminobutyricimonas sp. LJ205]|uniref:amidohydrolase family protein n=1 Tax=Diaminobutyricimonas sp. LJ205 TaxID=2683590 RepID=UPI0012F49F0D|nr:amidohydrolase family protein [Diaminobutyricimonas sp. LJ205]
MSGSSTPPRGSYLIRGGAVISVDPEIGNLPQGDVLVKDGVIVDVGSDIQANDAEVVDASGMIVMPGLIETHHHMWSSLGRNFVAQDHEYFPAKWATSAHYEPEDFYRSVLLGLVDAANAGITTMHNWSHNTRTPEHADAELRAHRDGLIRARYSYGHRDLLPEDEALDFTDIDRVANEWFHTDSELAKVVHLGVNLRGPDLGDSDVFYREAEEARARKLPVSVHTMQGAETKVSARELEEKGLLGPDFLICHFLAATEEDRQAMVRTGTPLSFSVHSELRLGDAGDPRAALLKMVAAGVTVSLSIDATSLAPVNLFEAMHIAWNMGIPWQGTDTESFDRLNFADAIRFATINGAQALGLGDVTGSLTPGKRADLILIRKHDLNVAPVGDLESTVVRSVTPANVDTVLSDGRIIKRKGELVAFDVERIVREAEASAAAVLDRAGARVG